MNVELSVEPTRGTYRLTDRYLATEGSVLLTGIQALSRIGIDQLRLDRRAGRNTAVFVSGYPGSPLAGLADEVPRAIATVGSDFAMQHLQGVNEELAATAVMGSQLAVTRPDCRYDGITGIWYGKAPGLDRATDALRHAVFTGSSATGGALAIVGDDPSAKSSTMPSSSDAALVDLHMPVLYPANAAECLELGLHGIALSRVTGLWASLKVVTAVADGSGTVEVPVLAGDPVRPEILFEGQPWTPRPSAELLGPRMVEVERQFHEVRMEGALRYGIENGLNRITADSADATLGIVATGFTYAEVTEALRRLGLGHDRAVTEAGIRLLHLRMPIPFDRHLIRRFADGLDRIVVIEEKNPTLERLIRDALYAHTHRPDVIGKFDDAGRRILPSHGRLDADVIAPVLRAELADRLGDRLAPPPPEPRPRIPLQVNRAPYFCSGCPHNWGMKTDDGALVGMGTGCHGMGQLMDPERVGESVGLVAMGNEGVQWLGMAPFVDTDHFVQNLGDGTYFHSGQLAIQAAVGAGAHMTFKLLYNHTVAMTGGQDASHQVGPDALAGILLAQGVSRVAITTDDPDRYRHLDLPDGVAVHDRRRIVEVQRALTAVDGVTVLIHDQGCAAELRRDRKRNLVATPKTRVYINHRICEGCGDCGDVSGCLSVQPRETAFGRKTTIDQAGCNYDYSCLNGDCPAFATVNADDLDQPTVGADRDSVGRPDPSSIEVPEPPTPEVPTEPVTLRLAGIGGTGVVTVAQILGTAALLSDLEVAGLDQTGLSQKAGPVISDLVIGTAGNRPRSNLAGLARTSTLLAFDLMVAAADRTLSAVGPETVIVAGSRIEPTGTQVVDPSLATDDEAAYRARFASAGAEPPEAFDTTAVARHLIGVPATANLCLVGVAVQAGLLPVSLDALRQAVELNGVAVEANLAALEWGRRYHHDRSAVEALLAEYGPVADPSPTPLPGDLQRIVDSVVAAAALDDDATSTLGRLAADLVDYQDADYARRFLALVGAASATGSSDLTMATAWGFHKLLAYKDEYEVARLLLLDDALDVPSGTTVQWHLHPPLLAALGLERKLKITSRARPAMVALARGKRLRGTAFDPFGHTAMRRLERELVDDYEQRLGAHLAPVPVDATHGARSDDDTDRTALLVELAAAPLDIRGYESLKERRVGEYRAKVADLVRRLGAMDEGVRG